MPGNTIEKNEKETESQVWASCFDATSFQEMGENEGTRETERERERERREMEIEGNWLYRLFEGGVWEKNPFFFFLLLVSKEGRKSIHFFLVEEEKRNEIEKRECWRILRTWMRTHSYISCFAACNFLLVSICFKPDWSFKNGGGGTGWKMRSSLHILFFDCLYHSLALFPLFWHFSSFKKSRNSEPRIIFTLFYSFVILSFILFYFFLK